MKNLLLIIILLLGANGSFAQKVISSNGGTATAAGYEVSWTIGEAVIATVSDANNTLTQGFQQSKLTVTAIDDIQISGVEIKVYPNPTQDFVTIHFDKLPSETAYSLFDINGKLLERKNIATSNVKINMRSYSEGSYLLKLTDKNRLTQQTFKILKR